MKVPTAETYCAARVAMGDGLQVLQLKNLGHEDFVEPGPRAVVQAAEGLQDSGDTVSMASVQHRMKQDNTWENVGGAEWWSSLMGAGGTGDDIERQADIVRAASRLRTTDQSARKIRKVCNDGRKPREAISEVEDLTANLLEAQAEEEQNVMNGAEMAQGVMDMLTADEPAEMFVPTGFPGLDDLLDGLAVGRVNVVAARTGHGKSAFVDQLCLNVARRWDEKKVLKFDLENSETAVKSRIVSNLSGVPAQAIKRHAQHKEKLTKAQFADVQQAADQMSGLPLVVDTTSGADSRHIRSRCLAEEAQAEVGLVVVDYVTQMGERGDGAMEKAMNAVTGLHELAKSRNIPVVAVSQVNRKPAAGDTEPQLHHLSWSDDLAQVPAQVHMLFHPHTHWEQTDRTPGGEPDESDLFLYTRKNKGPSGAQKLKFDPDTLRIQDPNDRAPF